MKKIVFALFLASTVAFGQQSKKADLQKAGLQGEVKSYRMIGYELDKNGKEQLMNSESYAEFDRKGMNTKVQARNGDTVVNYIDKRDEKGNLIESDSRDTSNTSMSKNTYEYDERSNRVCQDVVTPDGSVFMSRVSAHDVHDRLIEVSECLAGLCGNKTVYVHDNNDKVSEKREPGKGDVLKNKTVPTYDAQGNAVEKKVYDGEGNLKQRMVSELDAHNDAVEVSHYDADGAIAKKKNYTLVYDKKKNWTKRTTIIDGKPTMIMVQKVKYF